jgi:hypothetical protein
MPPSIYYNIRLNEIKANNVKLTGGKSEKGITFETIMSFNQ